MDLCNISALGDCQAAMLEPLEMEVPEYPDEDEIESVDISAAGGGASLMPVPLRVTLAAIMIFMITIGFLGNAIVCLIVYQKPAMRSAINLLLATLAFSDIMLSLLCMPFTAVTVATSDYRFGGGFCRTSVMLYWLFVLEGVSILLIISVDRFLIIVQRQDKLTPHRAKVLIAASWVLSLCVALPSVAGWRTQGRDGGNRGYYDGLTHQPPAAARGPQCILGYSESLADRGYTVLLAVAVFFVPFSVMLYSYLCILNTVRRNATRIHNQQQAGFGVGGGAVGGVSSVGVGVGVGVGVADDRGSDAGDFQHHGGTSLGHCQATSSSSTHKLGLTGLLQQQQQQQQQRPPRGLSVDMSFKTRAFTTILILFIGFSVCWLPHTVVSLLAVFSRKFYFSAAFYPVSVGALWLSYLKAVFNPVIYCWRIRKFREACLEFMPKTCRFCPKVPGRSRRRIRPSNIYICSSESQSAV